MRVERLEGKQIGPDEIAYYEPAHLDLYCLQISLFLFLFCALEVTYYFGYKMESFAFQNNPKYLDLSYEMDLDLWDCLGRVCLI